MQRTRRLSSTQVLFGGAIGLLATRYLLSRARHFDYAGKRVLLTGGSRGLGLVLARKLLRAGAKLTLCGRNADSLAAARQELHRYSQNLMTIECDVTDPTQIVQLAHSATERFGGIDILINNAGRIEVGPMENMTPEDFELALKTHFWGPLHATLQVLPAMRRQRWGRIVNIASVGGKIAVPHLLPYSASKFALVGLSEGLATELRRDNIFVTAVCPGLMRTGSPRNATFKGQHRKEYAWFDLGDALPVGSMSAERAADQILRACQSGRAEVVLSLPAKAAVLLHDLFPNLTIDFAAWIDQLLPSPLLGNMHSFKGSQSESAVTGSALTILDRRAAIANNQL